MHLSSTGSVEPCLPLAPRPHPLTFCFVLPAHSDVIEWAEEAFRQEVAGSGEPNLAKACMLLSLEEEAAAQVSSGPVEWDSSVAACAVVGHSG